MRRDLLTPLPSALLLLAYAVRTIAVPVALPLAIPIALSGCAARTEITVDGAVARCPVAQDSVLVWQPIVTGERARIRMHDGSHLDAVVVGGNDSVLVIETRSTGSVFRSEPGDTIPRGQIASVQRRGPSVGPAFPLGVGLGLVASLAIVVAAIQDAFEFYP